MGMNTSGGRSALSEINVTPLVDVMLVLLVVFMVTTPIIVEDMQQRKVEIDLPTTNAAPVKPSELQTIMVLHKDFRVTLDLGQGESELVNCSQATPGAFKDCLAPLGPRIKNNKPLQDGRRVFLMADRGLPYGFVVDVMARMKSAGIGNLGMVTNPPESPPG
jgi:biopolymer transport protein TolR